MKQMKLMELALLYPQWLCKEAQKCIEEFYSGGWVVYEEDPHFPATTKSGRQYVYTGKKEAVKDLAACYLCDRMTSHLIKRGHYRYIVRDCDANLLHNFTVEIVSKENRDALMERWLLHMMAAPGDMLSEEAPEDIVLID